MLELLKNKYLLTAGAVIVFGLTIALGILYAKDRVALNDILNEEEAVNFAYLDAGVSPDDVVSYTAERDKALGEYVYRINFSSKDATYSYVVDANHGDIISGIKEDTGNGNIAQNNNSDNNNNPSLSIHEENTENTEKKPGENSQKDVNKGKTDQVLQVIPAVMPQINPQRQRQMIPQKTRLQKSLIKQPAEEKNQRLLPTSLKKTKTKIRTKIKLQPVTKQSPIPISRLIPSAI